MILPIIIIWFPGPPNLFLNGDEVPEDIRKWTVNDVYNFVNSIPTCSEYAQVSTSGSPSLFHQHSFFCVFVVLMWNNFTLQTFKDHMIDGETLPLLSEEHLLDTLGLKLGPALKIRSQVKKRYSCIQGCLSCSKVKLKTHIYFNIWHIKHYNII